MALANAVTAWTNGDVGAARHAVLEVWRSCRGPRLGALARVMPAQARPALPVGTARKAHQVWLDTADAGDPEDVPRLLDAVIAGNTTQGVERLAKLPDDPRLTVALVGLLEAPPRTSNGSLPFWRAVLGRLEACGDPTLAPALAALGEGYAGRVPTSVGETLGSRLVRLAARLAEVPAGADPDDPALAALEQALARELASLKGSQATARAEARSEGALLQAVWDAPDDDGPRHVLADWLIERGDPRGPWMARQLAGSTEPPPPEAKSTPLGAIAGAVSSARYTRGFADAVWLWGSVAAIPKAVGRPEWRTVRELHVHAWPSPTYAPDAKFLRKLQALILHDVMAGVRRIKGPRAADLAALAARGRRMESVGVPRLAADELPVLAEVLASWRPTHVEVGTTDASPAQVLGALPLEALASFKASGHVLLADWLPLLDPGPVPVLAVDDIPSHAEIRVARGPDGRLSAVTLHPSTGHEAWRIPRIVEHLRALPTITSFAVQRAAPALGFTARLDWTRGLTPEEAAALDVVLAPHGVSAT